MDELEQVRLREILETMVKAVGKQAIGATVQRAISDQWENLCWIADHYRDEACLETWKDAENQWRRVAKAARVLGDAIDRPGALAGRVPPNILPPSAVQSLENLSRENEGFFKALKVRDNGIKPGDLASPKTSLLAGIWWILDCPEDHVQHIAAAIHAWKTKDEYVLYNPDFAARFGEHAIKPVRDAYREAHTPPCLMWQGARLV